jgi:glycosyltransferase involved in cell wall biosynthesis
MARPISMVKFRQLVEKVTISIVIPCYNKKNTIERIAEAVRSAPIQSKEIIVVDDCSEDGTMLW